MAYANFDLRTAIEKFELSKNETSDLFAGVEGISPSETLLRWLEEFAPTALGINTEMARREMIIMPILAEAKRRSKVSISVLPGVTLAVDESRGLTGVCDYLVARSAELYYLEAPVVAVVEAKREDLSAGLGQCVAEMVAIQIFNERRGKPLTAAHGCVTSGNLWRFLKLEGKSLSIDLPEYGLRDLEKILGILVAIAGS